MAAKPENSFIGRIHKKLPLSVYHMKNNNAYTAGVPDVWYSGDGGDLWVEYKYVDPLPVSVPVRPMKLLSALQAEWLAKRYDQGRNVAVIIGCKTGGIVLRDKKWVDEIPVALFRSLIQSHAQLAEWVVGEVTK